MSRSTGKLAMHAIALDPIHHGAGTSGNTQILRVQEIVLEDGSPARVPFISGNSVKHLIRDGAVRFALEAMQVPDGALSKHVVDLLFSGGKLTKASGAVRLARAREIAELFPALSLCGYAAGNYMAASKLRVDHLHLLCVENQYRAPDVLADRPALGVRAGAYRGEEFGTRHEASRLPHVARVLALPDAATQAAKLGQRDEGTKGAKVLDSQMIYDFQVIKAGAELFGAIHFEDLSPAEMTALRTGLARACEGMHGDRYVFRLGAKGAVGFGRVAIRFSGTARQIDAPDYGPSDAALPAKAGDDVARYAAQLRERNDEILATLEQTAVGK